MAEEMLSTHEVDVAHLLAEHRADTDELRRLRVLRDVLRWAELVIDGPDTHGDVLLTIHTEGDGYTPFATYVTEEQATAVREVLADAPSPADPTGEGEG